MRKLFLGTAVLAAACLFQTGAYAQLAGNITANIPFSFHVGDQAMPAGNYTMKELADRDMEVRNDQTDKVVLELGAVTETVDPSKDTELIFNRYGNSEFLRKIKVEGETEGIEFLPSKTEQKLIDESQPVVMHSHPAQHNGMARHS